MLHNALGDCGRAAVAGRSREGGDMCDRGYGAGDWSIRPWESLSFSPSATASVAARSERRAGLVAMGAASQAGRWGRWTIGVEGAAAVRLGTRS